MPSPSSSTKTSFELTVYYEDTDAGGVVYHSNYLNFMERARSEWMNGLGWDVMRCTEELSLIFVVASANLEFKTPARLMDRLVVHTEVIQLGKVGLGLQQDIYNKRDLEKSSQSKQICSGIIRLAALDSKTFKLTRVPEQIRELMKPIKS